MPVVDDVHALVDKAFFSLDHGALENQPLSALKGVSEADQLALQQALGVNTIRDWAEHPAVLAAQAIAAAAKKKHCSSLARHRSPRRDARRE